MLTLETAAASSSVPLVARSLEARGVPGEERLVPAAAALVAPSLEVGAQATRGDHSSDCRVLRGDA